MSPRCCGKCWATADIEGCVVSNGRHNIARGRLKAAKVCGVATWLLAGSLDGRMARLTGWPHGSSRVAQGASRSVEFMSSKRMESGRSPGVLSPRLSSPHDQWRCMWCQRRPPQGLVPHIVVEIVPQAPPKRGAGPGLRIREHTNTIPAQAENATAAIAKMAAATV